MIVLNGKLTETRPLDVVRAAWRTITRESYRAVGLHWVREMLPGHFAPSAHAKYRYKQRSQKYLRRKGGGPDLVMTGYMKQEVMSNVVVRGFPSRATVIMYGPAYLNIRYRKNMPDMPKEITTVTPAESQELARVLEQELLKRIEAYRATKVTTT